MAEDAACPCCGASGSGRYCSDCGAERARLGPWREFLRALAGPFYEYFSHARKFRNPAHLVGEVRSGWFRFSTLTGFVVSACVIILAAHGVEKLLGRTAIRVEFLPSFGEIAGVSEGIAALFATAVLWIVYVPAHLLLNRGRGDVTLRQFLIVTVATWALFAPWFQVLPVLFGAIGAVIGLAAVIASIFYYVRAYALLYRRSLHSAALLTVAGWLISGFAAMLLMSAIGAVPGSR
jgi:hypothetical protein